MSLDLIDCPLQTSHLLSKLQDYKASLSFFCLILAERCTAVRKNRYVILPVDFEEAWKVCCLLVFGWLKSSRLIFLPFSSKLSRGPTRPTNSVSFLSYGSPSFSDLSSQIGSLYTLFYTLVCIHSLMQRYLLMSNQCRPVLYSLQCDNHNHFRGIRLHDLPRLMLSHFGIVSITSHETASILQSEIILPFSFIRFL